jgi:hypothetical protein
MSKKEYRAGTKRHLIAELANSGISKREAFAELRPLTEAGIKPMVFSANVSGSRVAKPMAEQLVELKNEIGRVYAILGRSVNSDFDSEEIDVEVMTTDTEVSEEIEIKEEPAEEPAKPRAKGKVTLENSLREFLRRVREIRAFCERRAELSETVDSISMRPVQAAAKLIPAGIPVDALLFSMTMHWSKDTRQDAGISDFDFVALSKKILAEREIREIERSNGKKEIPHILFGYAIVLAENRQPIMLIGPAGTGKSHLAAQLADYLGVAYGETPMSPGATRGDLLGRHTIGGFISAEFVELYGKGGVFNFEEIDASDASMLIVLNNALASGKLYNSASGEMVDKHDNFIPISTANTLGLGANTQFTARERLDAATIDRWRMGRIFVPLDERVEESILGL